MSYISSRLNACTNQELEDMMETLYGDRLLYNYRLESRDESDFPYDSHDRIAREGD